MVKVILIRHDETDWNRARRIQGGNSDTQLNQNGRQGAKSLALRLKPEKIQAIYTSPLQRARETAQVIARYHQLEVKTETTLKEIEVGELEGVTIADMGMHLSQLLTKIGPDWSMVKIPDERSDRQLPIWRCGCYGILKVQSVTFLVLISLVRKVAI